MKINEIVKKSWKLAASAAGLVIIFMWAAGSCTHKIGDKTASRYEPGKVDMPDSKLHVVKTEMLPSPLEIVGTVTSEDRTRLASRLNAEVKQVRVTAGSIVKKDQVLIELDDREINEQYSAAQAQFNQAETEYNRTKQLMDKEATTKQALTASESAYRTAKAQLERVKVMLSFTRITSPIDGIITDRLVEPGDLAGQGQAVAGVYDPYKMRLDTPVPVRLIDKIKLGQDVAVSLDRPSVKIKGRIAQIVSEVDPVSRTQTVKVTLDKTEPPLLPGTFGRLTIEDSPRPTILVPSSCVYRTGQIEFVQVLNRAIENRLVKTGAKRGEMVEILSGLSDGERVLLTPSVVEEQK
jgi:RND family efflux transporter MFP subunit